MTTLFTKIFQGLAVAAQVGNLILPLFGGRSKVIATGVIGLLQGVQALAAHNTNPDGTPATH